MTDMLTKNKGIESNPLKSIANKFLIGMMIFCSTLEWMGIAVLFSDSLSLLARAAGCVGAFGLAFLSLLVTGNLNRLMKLMSSFSFALLGYIILIVITFILYVINKSELNVITRGIGDTLYQLLPVLLSIGFAFMFGEDGIYYCFVGVVISYGLVVLKAVATHGIATIIHDWIGMLRGEGDTQAVYDLETHALVGGMGYFIYYFTVNLRKRKYTWVFLLAVLGITMLAFKRTLIISALGSVALYIVISKVESIWNKKVARIILGISLIILLVSCYLYILFIKSGMFYQVVGDAGVDTSGRAFFYKRYEAYYDLSLGYIGKGLGWVERNAKIVVGPDAPEALHNQVLQMYIELGGVGFLLFFGYMILGNTLLFEWRYGFQVGKLYGCMSIYMITYSFIANGMLSWAISTAIWVCVLGTTATIVEEDLLKTNNIPVQPNRKALLID